MDLSTVEFSWLRPLWLLALILLPAIWWLWRRRHGQQTVWQRSVDAHLLPHLLQHIEVRGSWGLNGLWLVATTLVILALAGPSLRQQAAPLWQLESPLVVALDLSAAMRAADLPPSRLAQARAKLKQLLETRRNGQVGLLVYAGDAFTVAPITRDARTVTALLDSLSADIMPVQGQRADRAINHAMLMLRDNDTPRGEILLISDRVDLNAERAAMAAREAGVKVSVLGVGTLAGAPLTGANGFITGPDGQALLARLDPASLAALATAGGGRYAALTQDDADLRALGVLDPVATGAASARDEGSGNLKDAGVSRSDDGYWLVLLVLPLMLLGFRRGWLALLPLVMTLGLALPSAPALAAEDAQPADAAHAADADAAAAESKFSWDALWQRADQRAYAALQAGDNSRARALAPDPDTQGAAAYRGDDFAAAAESWAAQDNADAHYNRGNALARSGKLEDALHAYDQALAREPGMADAVANRKVVEDALKQQQAQDQKGDKGEQGEKGEEGQQDQQQPSDSQPSDSGEPQSGEQQPGEQQDAGEPQPGEQQDPGEDGEKGQPQSGEEAKSDADKEAQSGEDQQATPEGDPQQRDSDGDGKPDQAADESPPKPEQAAEAAKREAAEAAAKQEMQQALDAQKDDAEPATPSQAQPMTPEQRAQAEQRQATEQWLRRVPDDPGALLRRKFELEYRRRLAEGDRQ